MASLAADKIASHIISLTEKILERDSLNFDPERTQLFEELISLLQIQDESLVKNILGLEVIKKCTAPLRAAFLHEQIVLEKHWATLLLRESSEKKNIQQFPFFAIYDSSSSFIYYSIKSLRAELKNMLYIGSGAMPLNAIFMAQKYGMQIGALDLDPESCELSQRIISAMDIEDKVKVICQSAQDFKQFADYDVIILAALVGTSEHEKESIIRYVHKHMRPEQLLVVKNFVQLKSLLFHTINVARLSDLQISLLVEKPQGVTNQFIFIEK